MISCPNCHNQIEILERQFGTLFSCPQCAAVFYINFSGQPEVAEVEPEIEPQVDAPSFNQQSDWSPQENEAAQGFQETEQSQEMSVSYDNFESNQEQQDYFNANAEILVDQGIENHTDINNESSNFADIADYGNADVDKGPLTYRIFIQGLETSQVLIQLRAAMTDSRFGWDVDELLVQVKRGQLEILALSPTKAFVLINRIKYLPLKISWRQDVLSNS